ncbi:MAG TPA: cupredoxin family copper-binding protein [Stellaceae bacterium]|nr:cupredoxin family copper-binding protein [Stellaceae bacterium]
MVPKAALILGALGAAAALVAAAPRAPSAYAANAAAVQIDNFHYSPPMLVVAPGTTVTWTNADDEAHSVREKDGKFKSAALDTDDKFSQSFTAPGEYEYFCSIHPYMTGKIVVKSAGS